MASPPPSPSAPLPMMGRGRATLVLIGLRVAYAYNWFDLGPGLPAVSSSFGVGTDAWGVLLAAFFVGAGLLQVPAGLLARRFGTRSVSLWGAALLGAAALASALSPSYPVLVALRFGAGAGAGLFFSPAIALVASLHPAGERGLFVGTFSSAFSAGAGAGVFVSALLVPSFGWRVALGVGGLLLLLLLAGGAWAIPSGAGAAPPGPTPRGVPRALRNRGVWGIGLAFIGLEGASLSSGQYFVPYAQSVRGWSPVLAGAIAALFVFPSVFGGPVGGRLAERFRNRRTQMVLGTAVPALLLLLVPFVAAPEVAAIAATFSFSYGMVYATMYILPPYLPGLTSEDTPLAIGLLNAVQLAGGAGVAFLVGLGLARLGYTLSWELLALLVLGTLAALSLVPETRPNPGAEAPAPAPG